MTVTPSNLWSVLQGFNVMACLTLLNLIIDTVNEGYPLGAVLNLHVECSAIDGRPLMPPHTFTVVDLTFSTCLGLPTASTVVGAIRSLMTFTINVAQFHLRHRP